jgi:hypothetical protein
VIEPLLRGFVKFLSIVFLSLIILIGALLWRLSAGPISIDFLTPYLQSILQVNQNGFDIKLESTTLGWSSSNQSFDIRLLGAKATNAAGKVIAEIPEFAITISGAALVKGKLAPSSLTMFDPLVNVVRTVEGKIEFKFVNSSIPSEGPGLLEQNVVGEIFRELIEQWDKTQPLGYLRRINIIRANVIVTDRQLAVNWNAPETDIFLFRENGKISVSANLALKLDDTAAEQTASIKLKSEYDLVQKKAKINFKFVDLNPRIFASLTTKFMPLNKIDLPLSGTIHTVVLSDGKVQKFEFNLTSDKGRIVINNPIGIDVLVQSTKFYGDYDQFNGRLNVKELSLELVENGKLKLLSPINHELTIQKVSVAGNYDTNFDRFSIEKLNIFSDGLTVAASATIQKIGDKISFELGCEVKHFTAKKLRKIWPKGLANLTRDWITQNVLEGFSPSGHVRVMGNYHKRQGLEVTSLFGDMDVQNMVISNVLPMAKLEDVGGRIKFDDKRFDIELTNGKLNKIKLNNSHITFTGLDQIDQYVNASLNINGPFSKVLEIVENKPFAISKFTGFSASEVKGDVTAQIAIDFPLRTKIRLNQIVASAEVLLKNVYIPEIALNQDLSEANLNLSANNKRMIVKGRGQLGGVWTEIYWRENFSGKETYRSKYKLKATVDGKTWREKLNFISLGNVFMTGPIASDIIITIGNDKTGDVEARMDLKNAIISLPKMGWHKPSDVAATSTVSAKYLKGNLISLPKFMFKGGGMDFIANAAFNKVGKIKRIMIERFRFDDTDVRALVTPYSDKNNKGWNIDLAGKKLNLISWLASEEDNLKTTKSDFISLSLNVGSVLLYPNKNLKKVEGMLIFDGWVWHTINLKSRVGENKKLGIFLEAKDGKRFLRVSSNDAGAVLQTFDYYDNLIGGKLSLGGEYDGMLPESVFVGHVRVDDFRVIKAPLLAELLNVASITGIIENLQGVGLGFAKLYAPFENKNDIITIKDASVSGLSLGMTASGVIDSNIETIGIKGTIVPVYALNTALTRIPIIGDILSGGEKDGGIFAARYSMNGSIKKPKISTNPLSVFAPGILRGLFKLLEDPVKSELRN